jgi:hypothetical protein
MKPSNKSKNWFGGLFAALAVLLIAFSGVSAQAQLISSLNTGAGLYSINTTANAPIVDPNWSVSLLSTNPPNQTPPGGNPNGMAYLVPNDAGYPINTYWLANDATSTWLTYSTPTQIGADQTGDTFQYQLTFQATSTGTAYVNFLTDNTDTLAVNGGIYNGTYQSPLNGNIYNGTIIGSNPNMYSAWLPNNNGQGLALSLTAGTVYTVDLDVYNIPQSNGNPTGGRVEFTGDVTVAAVPEPSTWALMLGGVGLLFGLQRIRRRTV